MGELIFETPFEDTITDSLNRAVIATFGEMAFMDVLAAEKTSVDSKQITSIDIASPFRAKIIVRLPLTIKKNIVEYIHGQDWDDLKPDQIDDCLLELLNVMGGTFLFNIYGESTPYKVLFPEMIFDESEISAESNVIDLFYDAEGEYFSVSFIGDFRRREE